MLKGQVGDREKQLMELKSLEPEKLQSRISELETSNQTQRQDYEKQLHQQSFDHVLNAELAKSGARNPKALKALLDMNAISLEGDMLVGLQEQLEALMQSDPYLFDLPTEETTGATNPAAAKKGKMSKEKLTDEQFFAQAFK